MPHSINPQQLSCIVVAQHDRAAPADELLVLVNRATAMDPGCSYIVERGEGSTSALGIRFTYPEIIDRFAESALRPGTPMETGRDFYLCATLDSGTVAQCLDQSEKQLQRMAQQCPDTWGTFVKGHAGPPWNVVRGS